MTDNDGDFKFQIFLKTEIVDKLWKSPGSTEKKEGKMNARQP
jgi:hypothetical protein